MPCGMLVPQPGIEPMPPILEAWSLSPWMPGKSLMRLLFEHLIYLTPWHQDQTEKESDTERSATRPHPEQGLQWAHSLGAGSLAIPPNGWPGLCGAQVTCPSPEAALITRGVIAYGPTFLLLVACVPTLVAGTYPHRLTRCLLHAKCSGNIYWLYQWMNGLTLISDWTELHALFTAF